MNSLPNSLKATILGGLIAGTLDMTAACVQVWLRSGVTPFLDVVVRVSQFIASGAIGPEAFNGGKKTVALGLAFHYLIATVATLVFYLASRKLRLLVNWFIVMGLLYGVLVYLFMNFIVVPSSKIVQRATPTLSARLIAMLIIMFCIGLPISLIVRRFSK